MKIFVEQVFVFMRLPAHLRPFPPAPNFRQEFVFLYGPQHSLGVVVEACSAAVSLSWRALRALPLGHGTIPAASLRFFAR